MEVRHFSARSPRSGGCPSLESNSRINVKDSATGTFVNKDVTSKLTIIISSGSREISEISWTKCEKLRICEEVFPVYSFRIRARYWAVL